MSTENLTWYDARELCVEGKGWSETERFFDRLPARAKAVVPAPVWDLSRLSTGIAVRFETDAAQIDARWTLLNANLAMDHMPALGCSGLDLYVRDRGRLHWAGSGRCVTSPAVRATLLGGAEPVLREFTVYLPLYNGIETLEIGVAPGRTFRPALTRGQKPVVFYGTSIVHGGCASRPGMAYPNILERRLDRPIINLGFSGAGRAEPELAELLTELDPAVYVIDPLPNLEAAQVTERIEPFVGILRRAHARVPIVLVENIRYQDAGWIPSRRERCETSNAALKAAYERLAGAGVTGLHYVRGERLLGGDGDATVDGTHPNDLGFSRIADALEPVLKPLV